MSATRSPVRLKLLKALRKQVHRYDVLRALGMTVSIGVLAAVPALGLARVDAWGGDHRLLGQPAPLRHAIGGVVIGIAAMYVVTFLANLAAGRLFCGWGCPVGQVSRFGEATDTPGLSRGRRLAIHLKGAAFSAAFVLSVLAWWTDLAVLWAGSGRAMALAWAVVAVGVGGAFVHGRWWRWRFCQTACPIGLYYTFVSPADWYGITFDNRENTCIECDACDHVCPVDLAPRELDAPIPARGGMSIADAPGHNHCLECGDCVRACEMMIDLRGRKPVPLRLGWERARIVEDDAAPATDRASDFSPPQR